MSNAYRGRPVVTYKGMEWAVVSCLKENGNKILCRLLNLEQDRIGKDGYSHPFFSSVSLDRDCVVSAFLKFAKSRNGTSGVVLFNTFYPVEKEVV